MKTRSGRRLSQREVEKLAKEAEKGYALSKARRERARPGRPSLDEGVSPRISYRVADGLYVRAKKKAEAEGRTVSELAREALEAYVS
jgi:hypothetical protein